MELENGHKIRISIPEGTDPRILQAYINRRKSQNKWYDAHKEQILAKRKEEWRAANPNPKPRGRPKKVKYCEMCSVLDDDGTVQPLYETIGQYYAGDGCHIPCPSCR